MDEGVGAVQGYFKWQRGGPGKREEQTPLDCSLGDRDPASWYSECRLPPERQNLRSLHTGLCCDVETEQNRELFCSLLSRGKAVILTQSFSLSI